MHADVDKGPEIRDVGDHALQDHSRLQVPDRLHAFAEGCGAKFRARVATGLFEFLENIADGRQAESSIDEFLRWQRLEQPMDAAVSLYARGRDYHKVLRARLQTATRRDEMEQARTNEAAATDILRFIIGYDINAPIAVIDLMTTIPEPKDIDRYAAATITTRPEFVQFDFLHRAAEQEISLARADRRPQLVYSINGGFDSDTIL